MLAKYLGIACAVLVAICTALAWNTLRQAQNIGAYRAQLAQNTAQLAAERDATAKADASLVAAQAAAQAAQARAASLDRTLQEAKRHDLPTQEWAAACGARVLPCAYREWLLGHVPAECVDRPENSKHLSTTDAAAARPWPDDGRGTRILQARARGAGVL